MNGNGHEQMAEAAEGSTARLREVRETSGEAPEEVTAVRHTLIGMIRGGEIDLDQSAAAIVTARRGAELHQSATLAAVSGGPTHLNVAAAVAVPSLGDVTIDKGAAQWLFSAGDVTIEKGGCGAAVAPAVRVERGGIGVALARRVEVGDGGRVLFGPRAAAALGAAIGIGFGLAFAASTAYAGVRMWRRVPGPVRRRITR